MQRVCSLRNHLFLTTRFISTWVMLPMLIMLIGPNTCHASPAVDDPALSTFSVKAIPGGIHMKNMISINVKANVQQDRCLISQAVCPQPPNCGAYVACRAQTKTVVCQQCSPTPPNSHPKTVCDFALGRCVPNNNYKSGLEGAICKPGAANTLCGRDLTCRRDLNSKQTKYRCCRRSCPPKAFGSPDFYWTNACGEKYLCPNGLVDRSKKKRKH